MAELIVRIRNLQGGTVLVEILDPDAVIADFEADKITVEDLRPKVGPGS